MAESNRAGISAGAALLRTGPGDWVIEDLSFARSDPRRRLANLRDDDTNVVVSWRRDVPLTARYLTAEAALEDVTRWLERPRRDTRPVPIAHFPPPRVH